mgnify:CR=1 FL=1
MRLLASVILDALLEEWGIPDDDLLTLRGEHGEVYVDVATLRDAVRQLELAKEIAEQSENATAEHRQ